MSIVKTDKDDRKFIKFLNLITLSNGTVGKQIMIGEIPTNYIICKNSDVVNIKTEKILKPFIIMICKYKGVNIQLGERGKYKTMLLHRLLGMAYIENPNNKPIINHKDGDKLNLDLSNLEWSTYSKNNKHAFDNNLKKPSCVESEKCNLTTHTKEQVIEVCKLLESGKSPKQISKENPDFGYDFVLKILRGKTWKSVSKDYNFPYVRKYSSIFSVEEINKMNHYFSKGLGVREVIDKMGWEFNEQIRSRVKHIKSNFKIDESIDKKST